ncbi:hypothetical protein [Candidatus Poriferisodalis sp.]|uniref:hypothetical protein n=1 Tax=Candidatus Poriferisodalis sp. TaxID=3101277 RepID=UPI003C6F502A
MPAASVPRASSPTDDELAEQALSVPERVFGKVLEPVDRDRRASGLDPAIVRRVAEPHGGTVTVVASPFGARPSR